MALRRARTLEANSGSPSRSRIRLLSRIASSISSAQLYSPPLSR